MVVLFALVVVVVRLCLFVFTCDHLLVCWMLGSACGAIVVASCCAVLCRGVVVVLTMSSSSSCVVVCCCLAFATDVSIDQEQRLGD